MNRLLPFLLAILWIAAVLLLSLQSEDVSNYLSLTIVKGIMFLFGSAEHVVLSIEDVNFFLRKMVHFFEYMVMAVLCAVAFTRLYRNMWLGVSVTWVVAVCLAFFDEWVQISSPGRTPSLLDVLIDASGVSVGIIMVLIIARKLTPWSFS